MCHNLQKSIILDALYGERKLTGSFKPNNNPNPRAISEYAEKIKIYLKCKAYYTYPCLLKKVKTPPECTKEND